MARSQYLNAFDTKYNTTGTRIDTCITCHNDTSTFSRNPYGLDMQAQLGGATNVVNVTAINAALTNIEPIDSDNDGFINLDEIHNLTFPGNASDHPANVTPTATATVSPTATATATVTPTVTATANVTPTVTATANVTPTVTATANVTATVTPTVTATVTGAVTPTVTVTGTAVVTPTVTGTPPTAVPEFPTVILPVAAVMGLMLLLLYRRKV
ncbi:MAG: PEF-CTERM sorting domain-containing protein [Candidatus Methanoperedens sp.]|nr:PEF-CTERM sorting domain-containing protein [Candidatus Methanoperedens sp.]